MKTGKLLNLRGHSFGANGLCHELDGIDLFHPTEEDSRKYKLQAYWASEVDLDEYERDLDSRERARSEFGPTRQNIVLLMAAMAGEL